VELGDRMLRLRLWPDEITECIGVSERPGNRILCEFNTRSELSGIVITDVTSEEARLLSDPLPPVHPRWATRS
jgi:hypothetical protein